MCLPEPASGRPRCLSIASCVVREGSTLAPVPVTQKIGYVADQVPRDVLVADGQVGGDRLPVEEEVGVLGGVELAEHDRGVEPLGGADVLRVDAEADQSLAHEVAERVGTDLRQHGRTPTQAGRSDGHVGGGAAEVLRERRDVLERAVLLGVDVDADATDRQQLERPWTDVRGAHQDPT